MRELCLPHHLPTLTPLSPGDVRSAAGAAAARGLPCPCCCFPGEPDTALCVEGVEAGSEVDGGLPKSGLAAKVHCLRSAREGEWGRGRHVSNERRSKQRRGAEEQGVR